MLSIPLEDFKAGLTVCKNLAEFDVIDEFDELNFENNIKVQSTSKGFDLIATNGYAGVIVSYAYHDQEDPKISGLFTTKSIKDILNLKGKDCYLTLTNNSIVITLDSLHVIPLSDCGNFPNVQKFFDEKGLHNSPFDRSASFDLTLLNLFNKFTLSNHAVTVELYGKDKPAFISLTRSCYCHAKIVIMPLAV